MRVSLKKTFAALFLAASCSAAYGSIENATFSDTTKTNKEISLLESEQQHLRYGQKHQREQNREGNGFGRGGSRSKRLRKSSKDFILGIDVFDKYVDRGRLESENPVLQSIVGYTYKNFTVGGFLSYDVIDKTLNEKDIILDYTTSPVHNVSVSAGLSYGETQEAYAGIAFENILNPTLMLFLDFHEKKGLYSEVSIGHDFNWGRGSLNLDAIVAYNHSQSETPTGFSHVEMRVSYPISLNEHTTIMPSINYTLNSDKEDWLFFGAGLEYHF